MSPIWKIDDREYMFTDCRDFLIFRAAASESTAKTLLLVCAVRTLGLRVHAAARAFARVRDGTRCEGPVSTDTACSKDRGTRTKHAASYCSKWKAVKEKLQVCGHSQERLCPTADFTHCRNTKKRGRRMVSLALSLPHVYARLTASARCRRPLPSPRQPRMCLQRAERERDGS